MCTTTRRSGVVIITTVRPTAVISMMAVGSGVVMGRMSVTMTSVEVVVVSVVPSGVVSGPRIRSMLVVQAKPCHGIFNLA